MSGDQRPGKRSSAPITVLAVLVVGLVVAGCAAQADRSTDPSQMVDSGSWYVREQWPHDGHPYETEHFVAYSDAASPEARHRLGDLAEQVWADLIDEMGIDPSTMFRYPTDQQKVDVYANRHNVLDGGGARAYYAGIIIWSFDHDAGPESTTTASVRLTLRHEMVHVFEALLKGRFVGDLAPSDPRRMPVWFSEGMAEELSGGSTDSPPRTLDQIDNLKERYGNIDPISWKVDLPPSDEVRDAYSHYYYPMAHLAVQYLLDPRGLGRTPTDLTAVMLDMGNDVPFADAFAAHMGITQDAYEAQFFSLMDGYLPRSEVPWEAIGLGLAAVAAASVIGGSLTWGLRRVPAVTAGPPPEPSTPHARRGAFVAEAWLVAAGAVLVTVRALFSLGFDELPRGVNFPLGYTVVVGYVVVSAVILAWAARRSSAASRRAYVIPLLVVAATVAAVAGIESII